MVIFYRPLAALLLACQWLLACDPARPPQPAPVRPAVSAAPVAASAPAPVAASAPPVASAAPVVSGRAGPITRAQVGAPADALCLPAVSKECGCVYGCGIGWPGAAGKHVVHHPFWEAPTELSAHVEDWCVGGQCTRAFAVDIVCDGICPRRPADPGCHFDGDVCRGTPSP